MIDLDMLMMSPMHIERESQIYYMHAIVNDACIAVHAMNACMHVFSKPVRDM